jgi:photosystem II stability/assembly factor-like uncharacterized protein
MRKIRVLCTSLPMLLALTATAQRPVGKNHSRKTPTVQKSARREGPAPRFDSWRVIGPGGGGTMVSPTISPHDPNIIVEHCDMTGGYVTTDGGRSWRMFNLRAGVSTFAFDPRDPSVIYAGNAALWRSQDEGKSWKMIFPDPAKGLTEHTWSDHAEYVLTTKDTSYPANGQEVDIQAIAVDPTDSKRLYVVFGSTFATKQPSSLYYSKDGGRSWARLTEFAQEKIHAIHVQPAGTDLGATVSIVGESGVYEGSEKGWTHRPGPGGEKIRFASVGTVRGTNGPLCYVTTESRWERGALTGGIYTSADGGRTWQPATMSLAKNLREPGQGEPPQFQAISCSAGDGANAYVGFRGLRLGQGEGNLFNGIARTTNGGHTWTIVHRESNRPSENLEGSWIEERALDSYPNIWFDAPYSLGVAPSDPDTCYATDLFRTYRTTDGGRTWRQVNSLRVGDDRWTTRGLDVTTSYGVHFDPFDLRHMFITYTDIGLFQSHDAGSSWTGSTQGIPNTWRNTTYWLAFDPQVKDLVWGAFSATHDLPRPKMWRNRNPDSYEGGVAFSTDGAQHWTVSNSGMPQTAVTHILLDPTSPIGKRTLYACGFGRGVYKSTDNGKTWTLKNNGIEKKQPFAWRLARARDRTLYLVVARRSERGRIGDADDGAIYKSRDGGEHWLKMNLPEGTNGPTSLVVDPSAEGRLYLTAWGVAHLSGDTGGGVFLSTDGGQSWKNIFRESQHVYDLTIDPTNPRVVYICGFDAAAYRSIDGGATWTRIKGYNFKWGHRVILDPLDEKRIYITTFGGSVWLGPAAGDPNATEDIVTPRW